MAGKNKISLGVIEIQSDLGYNLKDYYKILMRKLREYSSKINGITYVTLKKN